MTAYVISLQLVSVFDASDKNNMFSLTVFLSLCVYGVRDSQVSKLYYFSRTDFFRRTVTISTMQLDILK